MCIALFSLLFEVTPLFFLYFLYFLRCTRRASLRRRAMATTFRHKSFPTPVTLRAINVFKNTNSIILWKRSTEVKARAISAGKRNTTTTGTPIPRIILK